MEKKPDFEDFIAAVDGNCTAFVQALHGDFMEYGCKLEVKSTKSGFLVSYLLDKKSVANFVFRKKGLLIRIYANQVGGYMAFLETLPDAMVKAIQDAPVCKRLLDPEACNPKCAMGYDFLLRGERHQKCRSSAFMFLVCGENAPFIRTFIQNELQARTGAS